MEKKFSDTISGTKIEAGDSRAVRIAKGFNKIFGEYETYDTVKELNQAKIEDLILGFRIPKAERKIWKYIFLSIFSIIIVIFLSLIFFGEEILLFFFPGLLD